MRSEDNIIIEIMQSQSLICKEAKFSYIHIKINNLKKMAENMMVYILDNSWLRELDNELDYKEVFNVNMLGFACPHCGAVTSEENMRRQDAK